MRRLILCSLVVLLCSRATVLADAKEDVLGAITKLAQSENYSWTTTAEGATGAVGGGADGRIQKDGLTMLNLTLRDGSAIVLFRGERGAMQGPDGKWQPIADAPPGEQPGMAQMVANMVRTYRPPAVQAQNLASKSADLAKTDDGFAGTLPSDEAKALMQRRGGRREGAAEVKDAKATVRFWLENGTLSRYQFHVQGAMSVRGEERQIDRTTTVTIKDVGTTRIDVPEEARQHLGS
jgi:hypothetical protein